MKGTLAIVGAVVLAVIVAAIIVPRMIGSKTASTGAVTTAETTNADRLAADAAADEARLAAQRDQRIEDAALARLEKELENAEPVAGKTDKQRLAEAKAWVAAHRDPNNPYNEVEARLLAIWSALLDGDEKSAAWLMDASLIEIQMTRALDADGDGTVTDEELAAFRDSQLAQMNNMQHPYIVERLDTDGDGTLSPEEMESVTAFIGEDGAFKGVIERARVDQWDTNGDGLLSDAEREDGQASTGNFLQKMIDQQLTAMEEAGTFDGPNGETMRQETIDAMNAQLESQDSKQMQQISQMMIAQELMEAMRLETMDQAEVQQQMMAEMPTPPDASTFDTDGEPGMSETEQAAFQQAMTDYQAEVQDMAADMTGRFLRAQFEYAKGQSDADGDGRLSSAEWEQRIDMLMAERDQRLFKRSYDLDQDGTVRSEELMNFLDWHKEGSLRADANYDGVVDPRDLQFMMTNYQRQEP